MQLTRLTDLLTDRQRVVKLYQAHLGAGKKTRELTWQVFPAEVRPIWQTFAVYSKGLQNRSRILTALSDRGIQAGVATFAVHRLPAFQENRSEDLPVSDALHDSAIALPLYDKMSEPDVVRVVSALEECLP